MRHMHTLYDIPAPAKLNLFLHITGRRADGYHLLQSAFMLLDWCDTLHIEALRSTSEITREDCAAEDAFAPVVPSCEHGGGRVQGLPADDLCVRAARALQAATGCTQGAHIRLHKRIPTQAGMGGGSSDAASTLLALNRLWGLGLNRRDLQAIGLGLGADVPFFLCGHNAWVQGIGEQITPLRGPTALPAAQFTVIKPVQGLPTGRIFASPDLVRNTPHARIEDFCAAPYGFGHNDLEPVARRLCDGVRDALGYLRSQGLRPVMTGSGSAVFAQGACPGDAPTVSSGWMLRTCANLPHHPLCGWVAD